MGDIYVFGAGATCIDVSAMGKGDGLMGPSCRPLCVFLSEIKHVEPASQLFHLFTVLFFLIHLARCVCDVWSLCDCFYSIQGSGDSRVHIPLCSKFVQISLGQQIHSAHVQSSSGAMTKLELFLIFIYDG